VNVFVSPAAGRRGILRAIRTSKTFTLVMGMSLLAAAACSSDNAIGPENQPEVANATDNFQLQATGLENVTQTFTYAWQNTGTAANVDQSGVLSGGTATLTIWDGGGAQVYSRSLDETGSFSTDQGSTGSWTIEVALSAMSGTLNFRAQKP
jgi:hypothetical protein